jgi:ribosomal protein L11 methyltransferase
MNTSEEFDLILTKQQRREIYQKCGFVPARIITSVLNLIKLSLAARAMKSEVLPLVENLATAKLVLEREQDSMSVEQPYAITLDLTPEQRELIKNTVDKDWLRVMICPDEHDNISYIEQWESDISPKRVGDSFVILPEGFDYSPSSSDKLICLPRGDDDKTKNTFGKGYHPTTLTVLRLMEKHLKTGSRVLDVGTGSGVLAVAAARLGAKSVLAVDVDSNAVYTAQKASELNNLEDVIEVKAGSLDSANGIYDAIIANLFPKVIISLAQDFSDKLVSNGLLLISGVVSARAAGIAEVLKTSGFEHHESISLQDWEGLVFYKKR